MAQDWRHAFTRIQIEFIEMPDLKLTLAQIRRLCDLTDDVCMPAVVALQESGFLWRAADGRFVRRASGAPAARSAPATPIPSVPSRRRRVRFRAPSTVETAGRALN